MTGIQMMNTSSRAFAGCIVTLVNLDTGELRVEHAAGYYYQTTSLPPPSVEARRGLSTEPAMILSRRTQEPRKRSKRITTVGVLDALRLLLDEIGDWEGTWRVRTISTPQTILADLKGRGPGTALEGARASTVEQNMLGKIGRLDMWEHS